MPPINTSLGSSTPVEDLNPHNFKETVPRSMSSTSSNEDSEEGFLQHVLGTELSMLEGYHAQDHQGDKSNGPLLGSFSNNLFGAPYQLLDSVDKRFKSVNLHTGSEYLRNILLHSPILHIRPGLAMYTGGGEGVFGEVRNIWQSVEAGHLTMSQALLMSVAKNMPFRSGGKLQRRMFGFQETYNDYMMHVNYLCRTMAMFLGLTDEDTKAGGESYLGINGLPNGAFINNGSGNRFTSFEDIRWENYRMNKNEYVKHQWEYTKQVMQDGALQPAIKFVKGLLNIQDEKDSLDGYDPDAVAEKDAAEIKGDANAQNFFQRLATSFNSLGTGISRGIYELEAGRVRSVQFMVEPTDFKESLSNDAEPSQIEGMADGLRDQFGSELAFITNSGSAKNFLTDFAGFLGDGAESAVLNLKNAVEPVTGGFLGNLMHGGIQSLKGQKMIYPDIYKRSTSTMDYQFSITLTSAYGNIYNYYMDLIVPLMHLVALAAPRMTTSNTVMSPYLVQAYIPGMCTCQLGIISNMEITKNPTGKHVSVNGFPLTIKVTFTIKELYNALSISPADDPASFIFNETLNDYLANLAGLIPSMDTKARIQAANMGNLKNYFGFGDGKKFSDSTLVQSMANSASRFFQAVGMTR